MTDQLKIWLRILGLCNTNFVPHNWCTTHQIKFGNFFWRVKPANPLPHILAQKVSTKVLMIARGQIFFCINHVVSYFRIPSFQFVITNSLFHYISYINIRFFSFTEMGETPNHLLFACYQLVIFSFQQIECLILSVFFSKLRFILVNQFHKT